MKMSYQTSWLIQDKVVIEKFWGDFSDNDVQSWEQEMITLLEQSPASKVHFLLELAEVRDMPSIGSIRQMTVTHHPKLGWVVIHGLRHRYVRALLLFTLLLFNLHYKIVEDEDEALEFLQTLDASLRH
jgi:hypothetical protein